MCVCSLGQERRERERVLFSLAHFDGEREERANQKGQLDMRSVTRSPVEREREGVACESQQKQEEAKRNQVMLKQQESEAGVSKVVRRSVSGK